VQFKEGESRKSEVFVNQEMEELFRVCDEFAQGTASPERFKTILDMVAGRLKGLEAGLSDFVVPDLPKEEEVTAMELEFLQEYVDLNRECKENGEEGLRLCRQGLTVLRGCLEKHNPDGLVYGQRYYFQGAQKIFQIGFLAEEIKTLYEEKLSMIDSRYLTRRARAILDGR
jgi:hypothetical protein